MGCSSFSLTRYKMFSAPIYSLTVQLKSLVHSIPLTNLALAELKEKKDKPITCFAFVIVDPKNAKWRNIFCVESEKELLLWIHAVNFAFEMCTYNCHRLMFHHIGHPHNHSCTTGTPNVSGNSLKSACLKSNKRIPDIEVTCIQYIENREYKVCMSCFIDH